MVLVMMEVIVIMVARQLRRRPVFERLNTRLQMQLPRDQGHSISSTWCLQFARISPSCPVALIDSKNTMPCILQLSSLPLYAMFRFVELSAITLLESRKGRNGLGKNDKLSSANFLPRLEYV